jgi:uncharacterized protein
MEKRQRYLDAYAKVETRKAEDGKMFIDGMIPYNSRSEEMWGFVEVIAPGAFKRTINNGTDIYAFWAHDTSQVLGSRKSGSLSLEDRGDGLYFSVELRDTAVQADYFEAIARGDVTGVSFGFFAEKEEWDNTVEPAIRTLKELHLLEVSPGVAFPAYPGAQSDAARRSLYDEGAPEFRSKFKSERHEDTSAADDDTLDPPDQALEARLLTELELIESEYGIKSTKE